MLVISGPQAERETFVADNKPAERMIIPLFSIVDSYKEFSRSLKPSESEIQNQKGRRGMICPGTWNGTSSPSVGWISSSCRAPAKHGTRRHGRLISDRQIEMVKARYTKINGSPPDEEAQFLLESTAFQVRRCIPRSTHRKFPRSRCHMNSVYIGPDGPGSPKTKKY
jgi:hypothetical protein